MMHLMQHPQYTCKLQNLSVATVIIIWACPWIIAREYTWKNRSLLHTGPRQAHAHARASYGTRVYSLQSRYPYSTAKAKGRKGYR